MKKSEHHLPHFLRFTRALALVTGVAVPAAIAIACGGSVDREPAEGVANAADGAPYDGQPMGTRVGDSGAQAYDGGINGALAYDGAVTGVQPYDGSTVGVTPYDGGGGVMTDASADSQASGGPLIAPELPA